MRKEEKGKKEPLYQITISISEENALEPFAILKESGENLSDIALFTDREKVVCKAVAEHFKAESPFEMDFLVELNGEYYDSDEYHMLYKKDSGIDKIINLELESLESIKKTVNNSRLKSRA